MSLPDAAGSLLLVAVAATGASGVPSLLRRDRSGERVAAGLTLFGSAAGLLAAAFPLVRGGAVVVPFGSFAGVPVALRADPLSSLFLIPLFLVSALASVYGLDYWPESAHPESAARVRLSCGLLTAAMAVVVTASSGLLLLAAWEVMALAAFFAATAEDAREEVREAGWVYLVATHTGTLALFALVSLLRATTGTFEWTAVGAGSPLLRAALFLLALVGFGFKAGIVPFHFWLPGAHANAPSHVSALLSGVMLNMGVYGMLRVTQLLPAPPAWWGALLLCAGLVTAITGILLALRERDLKRLLAYSSVENMGIVLLGLGLALLGRAEGRPGWALLGLAGAAFHVLNHSLFKSLLFFSAGALVHAEGTRDLEAMGGLLRRFPRIGGAFAVGSIAVTGMPPLNGFSGEWLLYLGLLAAWSEGSGGPTTVLAGTAAAGLALVGALSVATFVKAFGVAFLGEPRRPARPGGHDAAGALLSPLALLVPLCVLLGVLPVAAAPLLDRVARAWWPGVGRLASVSLPLGRLSIVLPLVTAALLLLFALLSRLRRPGTAPEGAAGVVTWDCGYAAPSARMQYTAHSFSDGISGGVAPRFLAPVVAGRQVEGAFPGQASFGTQTPDPFLERHYRPAAQRLAARLERLRVLQQGRLPVYLLYVFATVVGLLAWSVLRGVLQR